MSFLEKGKKKPKPNQNTQTLNSCLYPAASYTDYGLCGVHWRTNTEELIQQAFVGFLCFVFWFGVCLFGLVVVSFGLVFVFIIIIINNLFFFF